METYNPKPSQYPAARAIVIYTNQDRDLLGCAVAGCEVPAPLVVETPRNVEEALRSLPVEAAAAFSPTAGGSCAR